LTFDQYSLYIVQKKGEEERTTWCDRAEIGTIVGADVVSATEERTTTDITPSTANMGTGEANITAGEANTVITQLF
jgi:hypothetical protein